MRPLHRLELASQRFRRRSAAVADANGVVGGDDLPKIVKDGSF
jgi:hypothetical protein